MRASHRLPTCDDCGWKRRFCSREDCTNYAKKGNADCHKCQRKPAQDPTKSKKPPPKRPGTKSKKTGPPKTNLIKCTRVGCEQTVFLWKGPDEAHWPTKDQLLAERPFCLNHLVEHLEENDAAHSSTSDADNDNDNDNDTPADNDNAEAARAEQVSMLYLPRLTPANPA